MKLTISESRLKEIIEEELKNIIHKEGNVWKIRGHKGKGNSQLPLPKVRGLSKGG